MIIIKRFTNLLIVFVILVSGLAIGCGQTDGITTDYRAQKYGYSFEYPFEWFIDIEDELNLRIAEPNEEAYITMQITAIPLSGAAPPQEILMFYLSNAKLYDEVYYSDYNLNYERQLSKSYPAYELLYTHRGEGKIIMWQTKNMIAYKNGTIYDFTCSVKESTYHEYSSILDSVYGSLNIP